MRATFRAKLIGIVGAAALGFVALIAIDTSIGAQIEQQLRLIRDHHVPQLELGPRLNNQFEAVRRALQDAVAAQDLDALAGTRTLRDQFLAQLANAPVTNRARVAELRTAFEGYYDAAHDVSRRLIQGESGEELVEFISAMQARQLVASDALRRATDVDQTELRAAFTAVSRAERAGANIQLWLSLASLLLVLALSLWLSSGLLRSVAALSQGFERFGRGELREPIEVRTRDELGMLGERANAMALSLAQLQAERDRADWIKAGVASLLNELQGDLTPAELANRAVRLLARYLQLPAAVYYRSCPDGQLRPLAHYALGAPAESDAALPSFRAGEGLIGEAANQTELLVLDDLPPNYLRVRSGLGEAPPVTLALLPVAHAGKVNGVLELASWKPWSPLQRELLLSVRESLAVAFEVATAVETQRAQQEELREANEQLSAISSYKSQFLANMSHELRTPLNSMLLLSNLLAENENGNLSDKQIEFCRTIHGAGKDLLALINQVLDLAKIESGKQEVRLESFYLRDLVTSAERLVGPLARDKGLEFVAELAPGTPDTITSDRHKLEQILTNLLGNAVKFTERGSVNLRIGRAAADARLDRTDLSPREALAISVRDTGIGIAPEHQPSVFVPFEQVDARPNRRYGGTGLGLTIARELTSLLGGELQLQSAPGVGSTFTCYLPLIAAGARAARASAQPAAAPTPDAPVVPVPVPESESDPERTSVLVVEDDPDDAASVMHGLGGADLTLQHARSAEEALQLMQKERFECVVLDLGLPDAEGLKVLQTLQERWDGPAPAIFVHTGRPLDEAELQRIEAYADVVIRKSEASVELLREELAAFTQRLRSGARRRRSSSRPAPQLDGLKILLVDDDMRTVYALSALLRAKGAQVEVADTGRAALNELDAHPNVDLVLMDIMMPEMDGYEAMRRIRSDGRFRELPIVALTAKAMKGDSELCLAAGATDYLPKPVDPDRLLTLLHSIAPRAARPKRKASA